MKRHVAVVRAVLVGIALLIAVPLGCSKKEEQQSSEPSSYTIPGATDVLAALDRADYQAAVAAIVKVKASTPVDKRDEYARLLNRVKEVMVHAMATNDAAIKAYQALRFVETGR